MKNVTTDNLRRSNRTEPHLRWRVLASFFSAAAICLSANALEVYQIPGNVTDGIDLLGMSDNYYTDRLKGRNDCTISGEVTHSSVTADNPFLLMGSHNGATAFNPSTKLDTIPIRIVDGGYWKYQSNDGGNANYRINSGYGNHEMEKGVFGANAILLYGDAGGERSYLTVTNGCRLEIGTTIRVGLETNDGSDSGTLVLDGGELVMYTVLELGRGPNNGTAPYNASVNTANAAAFDVEKDYVLFQNSKMAKIVLKPGKFAIFYTPYGAHAPNKMEGEPRKHRKIVVKVRV